MKRKNDISRHLPIIMGLVIPMIFLLTGCGLFKSREIKQPTTTMISTAKAADTETKSEEPTPAEKANELSAEDTEEAPEDEEEVTEEFEEIGDDELEEEPSEEEHEHAEIELGSESYHFRNKKLLDQHYEKHGKEMGFASAEEYEQAASDVINSLDALFKIEAEDGDGVYYIEETNEFVILSTDGYIRTYFNPSGGKKYFDKQ